MSLWKHLSKYEWLNFLRAPHLQASVVLLVILLVFAAESRKGKIEAYSKFTSGVLAKNDSLRGVFKAKLDSLDGRLLPDTAFDYTPRDPLSFTSASPEFSIYPMSRAAVISAGASDLFVPVHRVSAFHYNPYRYSEDTHNPVLRLFGHFDMAFVIIYLIPLLVIVIHYNVIAGENEQGTIRLLWSQPVSLMQIIWIKSCIRFLAVCVVIAIAIVVAAVITGFDSTVAARLILATSIYTAFWFVLMVAINLKVRTSADSALAALSLWLLLALIFPVALNLAANEFYPVPSRARLITEYRLIGSEVEKKSRNEILNRYFEDHPELVQPDTTSRHNERKEYSKYYAIYNTEILNKSLPLFREYDRRVAYRNQFVNAAGFVSPAVIMQNILDQISGTSVHQYRRFFENYMERREFFLGGIKTMILKEQPMTGKAIAALERPAAIAPDNTADVSGFIVMVMVVLMIIAWCAYYSRRYPQLTLI